MKSTPTIKPINNGLTQQWTSTNNDFGITMELVPTMNPSKQWTRSTIKQQYVRPEKETGTNNKIYTRMNSLQQLTSTNDPGPTVKPAP